jgi:uncharacterized protein (TIGR02598 family)
MNFFSASQQRMVSVPLRRKFLGASAFSLVEVIFALGLVTFSVITLLGLIPMGLTTFRMAMATSVSSQIVQQVVTDAQQTDFSQLVPANSGVLQLGLRHFDDQGNQMTDSSASGIVYDVNVIASTPVVLTGGSATASPSLACLNIEIVSNPGRVGLTYDSNTKSVVQDVAHGIYVSRYSGFVAKNQ